MRHINIPIFIPHLGCPNTCVFCNQRTISGVMEFDISTVKDMIEDSLSTAGEDTEAEIAFFGGSFTGIDRALMIRLLEIAYSYVKDGRVKSIRCSTRPDYISEEILDTLEKYGVKTIELGLQSVSEDVLLKTKRGHSATDEEKACRMIVDQGFELVGQMMIGLPGSDLEKELMTADFIISMGAVGARIYPTVVFCDTELSLMTRLGEYKPLSLDEATERSARVFDRFVKAGVKVIRIGLCSGENLSSDKTYFAGPNHPALGELVLNNYYYNKILSEAGSLCLSESHILKVFVPRGDLSKALGQRKRNKLLLKSSLSVKDVRFYESDGLKDFGIKLQTETEERECI